MNSDVQEIKLRIEEEINCYRQIMAVVDRERGILLAGRHEDLLACAEEKLQLVQQLEMAQNERRQAMARISPDPARPLRLRDLGMMLPSEEREPFRAMLIKAQAMAERLAQASANNKTFVEEALDTVEHLLGILAGQGRPQAYNASGTLGARLGPMAPRMLAREV